MYCKLLKVWDKVELNSLKTSLSCSETISSNNQMTFHKITFGYVLIIGYTFTQL